MSFTFHTVTNITICSYFQTGWVYTTISTKANTIHLQLKGDSRFVVSKLQAHFSVFEWQRTSSSAHFLTEDTTSDLTIFPWQPRLPETLSVGETFPEQNSHWFCSHFALVFCPVDLPSHLLPVCLLQKTSHSPPKPKPFLSFLCALRCIYTTGYKGWW